MNGTQDLGLSPLVRIVDDDEDVRKSVEFVLRIAGMQSVLYADAESFLERDDFSRPGCAFIDIRMPGMNGMELQKAMQSCGITLPIAFLTGHGDIDMAVLAMKRGAADFIQKPSDPERLQETARKLIALDLKAVAKRSEVEEKRRIFETLTTREKEVAIAVSGGELNKVVAAELGVTEQTVKIHRANALRKLGCRSLVELSDFLRDIGETGRED